MTTPTSSATPIATSIWSDRQQRIKDEFIEKRGYWDDFWDGLLKLSPDFFEAYLQLSTIPWTKGIRIGKCKIEMSLCVKA